jgi:cell division cycle 20-like protein 1 (cofactor of APC complex)
MLQAGIREGEGSSEQTTTSLTQVSADLSPTAKVSTSKQASVYYPAPPPSLQNASPKASFTFRRVSHPSIPSFPYPPPWPLLTNAPDEQANNTFTHLLRSELFHNEIPQTEPPNFNTRNSSLPAQSSHNPVLGSRTPPITATNTQTPSTPSKNLFTYMSPKTGTNKARHGPNMDTRSEIYSLSPVRYDSQKMLLSPRKQPRAVSKVPYKVLDAPELADDFYLNLVDWGSTNILGVGLGSCVYMWNSNSGKVTKLCDLGADDTVTSVSWIQRVCTPPSKSAAETPSRHAKPPNPHLAQADNCRVPTSPSAPAKVMSKFGTQESAGGYEP